VQQFVGQILLAKELAHDAFAGLQLLGALGQLTKNAKYNQRNHCAANEDCCTGKTAPQWPATVLAGCNPD
jgi:hypothetical protein